MNNAFTKIFATAMLAATAAAAQVSPLSIEAAFDGRAGGAGLKGFTPESVVPVIRETKDVPAPAVAPIRLAGDVQTADAVPVALEVLVPASAASSEAVTQNLDMLATQYRFSNDPNFEPVALPLFHIMLYPQASSNQIAYLVRGVVPSSNLPRMKQAGLIRNAYGNPSVDAKGLEEVLLLAGQRLNRVEGVKSAYVGFDCGIKAQHFHITAHHPAIVVELDGSKARADVRQSIYQAVPALAVQPLVFVP